MVHMNKKFESKRKINTKGKRIKAKEKDTARVATRKERERGEGQKERLR